MQFLQNNNLGVGVPPSRKSWIRHLVVSKGERWPMYSFNRQQKLSCFLILPTNQKPLFLTEKTCESHAQPRLSSFIYNYHRRLTGEKH